MKNQNQAEVKNAKNALAAPEERPLLLRDAILTRRLTSCDPLKGVSSCIIVLSDIGDRMEPEIPEGSRAVVKKAKYGEPCSGELVVGLLKTGHVIFGVFHTPIVDVPELARKLWQIRPLNPKYPPAHYLQGHFHWLHPVEWVHIMQEKNPRYISVFKRLEYCIDDESLDADVEEAA